MKTHKNGRKRARMRCDKFKSIKWIAATAFQRVFSSVNLVKKNMYISTHICEWVWKRKHNNDGDNEDDEDCDGGGGSGDGGDTQTILPIDRIQYVEVLITQIIH